MKKQTVSKNPSALLSFSTVAAGILTFSLFGSNAAQAETEITVYKSPSCGCCGKWVKHLDRSNFDTKVWARNDLQAIKDHNGIPKNIRSCHTAKVGGYFIEGHVPAEDIRRLLAEKPDIAGLTVPGMPMGSPGMEVPGRKAMAYKVYAIDKLGNAAVFASH